MTTDPSFLATMGEANQTLERLRKAVRTMRTFDEIFSDTEDIYRNFAQQRLEEMTADIANGLRLAKNLADAGGFLEALDSYFDVFVDCFKTKYLPATDFELLRSYGSSDPEQELVAINRICKSRIRPYSNGSLGNQPRRGSLPYGLPFTSASEILDAAENEIDLGHPVGEASIAPKRQSKRWFKVCGQIGGGAGLMIWNVIILANDPTQSVGAVTSVLCGFQAVSVGYGDFRNE